MRKIAKKVVSILSIALLLVSFITTSVSAATYEKIKLPTYVYSESLMLELDYLDVEGVPVPYLDAGYFMSCLLPGETYGTAPVGDGTYKVSNGKSEMIVDPVNDTISFKEMEIFQNGGSEEDIEKKLGKYARDVKLEYTQDPNPITISMGKYGIDIIEDGGAVYAPISTWSKVLSVSRRTGFYNDGKVAFQGAYNDPIIDTSSVYNNPTRTEEEADFTYRDFCFYIDNFYGCPSPSLLSDSIIEKGFDATLETYSDDTREVKRLLKSTDSVDMLFGIRILDNMIYDGGHNYLDSSRKSYKETPVGQAFEEALTDKSDPRTILYDKWEAYYQNWKQNTIRIEQYINGYDAYEPVFSDEDSNGGKIATYYECGNTGIFVFDSFTESVIDSMYKAMDIAKEHGISNFVFDVSNNSGGDSDTLMFILAAITGIDGMHCSINSDNNKTLRSYIYDFNRDGIFEGADEKFDYKFNYAILCSRKSFSCGNALPCLAKEAGIPILGEKSGGGTCIVDVMMFANTIRNRISGQNNISYRAGGNLEAGATPDYDLTKTAADGLTDYSDFYNFELINYILNNHYGNNIPDTPDIPGTNNQSAQSVRDSQTVKVSNVPKTGDFDVFIYCLMKHFQYQCFY
ncbi:MAG: hypothetical protein K5644_08375 [Lachnospiraceae bacterium]|nr:hypothetical protein [Lachnospiraceae bacterium]